MKTEHKSRSNEPFKPEETPEPAQVKDPSLKNERREQEAPVEEKNKPAEPLKTQDTGRRLGESETQIDDETTI
jgi:hypothetical protein